MFAPDLWRSSKDQLKAATAMPPTAMGKAINGSRGHEHRKHCDWGKDYQVWAHANGIMKAA
jgi:hypothetical protein